MLNDIKGLLVFFLVHNSLILPIIILPYSHPTDDLSYINITKHWFRFCYYVIWPFYIWNWYKIATTLFKRPLKQLILAKQVLTYILWIYMITYMSTQHFKQDIIWQTNIWNKTYTVHLLRDINLLWIWCKPLYMLYGVISAISLHGLFKVEWVGGKAKIFCRCRSERIWIDDLFLWKL